MCESFEGMWFVGFGEEGMGGLRRGKWEWREWVGGGGLIIKGKNEETDESLALGEKIMNAPSISLLT